MSDELQLVGKSIPKKFKADKLKLIGHYVSSDEPTIQKLLFNPLVVTFCAFAGAGVCAVYMLRSPSTQASIYNPAGPLAYVVPIVVPFVTFLFERVEHWRTTRFSQYIVDLVVLSLAIGRVVANVPLVSGHTLFLIYAVLTARTRLLRITATVVLLQAAILKYFVWHDFITSTAGLLLGTFAALIFFKLSHPPR